MAGKQVKVNVGLDFTADNMSIDKIRSQIDTAMKAIKINLDPASLKKVEADLKEIGKIAERNLNKSTGKINLKGMDASIRNSETLASIEEIRNSFTRAGVDGAKSLNAISVANNHMEKGLKDSNSILTKMGTTLANTIRWNISASAINAVSGEFQKMLNFTKDLDRSLTDIRIVSGLSADNMARFAIAANKSAKELKVSTIDYANASLVFYQQGLKAIEVQNMTKASIIGGNITGQSTEEMSNLLTSVMNGYKIATEDVLKVTDKLAAVGATTAADFYELATAMSKVASMANAAGVPLDVLNAQIATIVSVTKESPESIGTSLKTIYGRMLAFKVDTKALMKDSDGEVFGAPKVEEALQAFSKVTGAQISLFRYTKDGQRVVKDLGDVINEVGNAWDLTTDKAAKFGLATALAGSRQQNRLVALFDSWEMYQDAVTTSLEAEGTSLRQNEIYMQSYAGKVEGLKAAKEELYMSMINSDGMKSVIDGLTTMVSMFTKISELTGGINLILGVMGAAMSKMAVMKLSTMMPAITSGGAKGRTPTEQEIEDTKKLQVIKNIYGADEANRIRKQIVDSEKLVSASKKKQDLAFLERQTLEEVQVVLAKKNMEESKQTQLIQIITQRAAALGVEVNSINQVVAAEKLLTDEKIKLGNLHKKANQGVRAEFEQDIKLQKEKIAEIKALIDQAGSDIENKINTTTGIVKIETGKEGAVKAEYEGMANQAERLQKATQMVQTTMFMLPSIIGVAKDESKGMADVFKTTASMGLPMVMSAFTSLIPVIATATAAGTAFSLSMLAPLLPVIALVGAIGLIGAAIKKTTQDAITFEKSISKLDEARTHVEQLESTFASTEGTLESVEDRIREINKLLKAGDVPTQKNAELQKELELLNGKRTALQEELIIQELLLENARLKAEEAAKEAATATMRSEYEKFDAGGAKSVDVSTELKNSIDAFKQAEHTIANYQGRIKGLSKDSLTYDADLKKLTESITEQEKIKSKARENMALHSAAIKNIIKDLGDEDGANKDLIASLQGILDYSLDVSASMLNLEGATDPAVMEDYALATDAAAEAMKELGEAYGDSSDKLSTYYDMLDEVNSKEGMSAKTKQAIIIKHAELLPYIDDEIGMRLKLTQIIEEEEKVQLAAYTAMIMSSEEFYNARVAGQQTMVQELAKQYDADLTNVKTLAESKAAIEEALIKHLAREWKKFYSASADAAGEMVVTMGMGGAQTAEGLNMAQNLYFELEKVNKSFDIVVGSFKTPDFKRINSGAGDKKGSKGGKGKDPKKEKEEQLAVADAYEAINFALNKNNILLDINKQRRSELGIDTEKQLTLMNAEIELHKDRQGLLHIQNEMLRAEGKDIQERLKSTFNFEGSWEDNSILITNMEAINGKSKEMEEDFKRIIAVMKELPKASAEWHKLNQAIQQIDVDKMAMRFDAVNKSLEEFNKELEDLDYNFKVAGANEFSDQMDLAAKKITVLANAIAQATFDLENMGIAPEKGSKAYDKFIEQQEKLNKKIREGTLALVDQEKSWDAIVKSQKEAAQEKYLKKINKELQDQRDELTAIEQIQESIVAIIRKRGEEENRILDENHEAEIKSLEERHNLRKKQAQESLDSFKKDIQARLDALNDQFTEEDSLEQLNKEKAEADRMQREIDVLSLDDSLSAKNKTIELRKQLADQNEKIAKMQQTKERDLLKKSLTDQLKDREETNAKEENIADESFNNEKDRVDAIYKANKESLELQYADAKVYAEARESIMRGTVEVAKGSFVDIYTAFKNFEDEFGKGMGIMGGIIKDDFLKQLNLAQRALEELARTGKELSRPRDDYTKDDIKDSDFGWEDPQRPSREPDRKPVDNSRPEEFREWSSSDFNNYIANKKKWDEANRKNDLMAKNNAAVANMILRQKYWGKSRINEDNYTYKQLESYKGYKDGGVLDTVGLFKGHGSETSSEVVFSAKTAKKLWEYIENMPKMDLNFSAPKMPAFIEVGGSGGNLYDIKFQIDGNLDRSILPEVEQMITRAIDKTEFQKRKELNKIGQFRPVS